MSSEKRLRINLGTFDFIKGVGILAVIFRHIQSNYPVNAVPLLSPLYFLEAFIASGLMPMFFIISGYGFKAKSAKAMLHKTFRESFGSLLAFFSVFLVLASVANYPVLSNNLSAWIDYLNRRIFSWLLGLPTNIQIKGVEISAIGAMWFLMALFWAQNILNQIVRMKSVVLQIITVFFSVAVGLILLKMNVIVYSLPQGLIAVLFCYIGYALKKYSILEKNLYRLWPYAIMLPISILHFCLVGKSGNLAFALAAGKFTAFDFVASTFSGILFVFLGVLCGQCKWKGLEWVKAVGVHTYWIMCIHSVEDMGMPWYHLALEKTNAYLWLGIEIFIKVVFILIGCAALKKLSQYQYLKKRMNRNAKV